MQPKITYLSFLLIPGAGLAVAQEEPAGPDEQTVPVAEAAPAPEPQGTSSEVSEDALFEEFARYRQLINEGTLDEADVAAKRVVEMAIRIYGPRSKETASALNNLAIVQHSSGQYDAAIQNFSSSIDIIEAVEDRLSASLVNPLKGLGAAQLAADKPILANKSFTRAAHVTQVNEGPHNIEQVEILESIAETLVRMGDIKSARNILDRIHVLNVRFYEKDPMGLIPSLMNRATWQHRAGYYTDERASYRRAIRIIETAGDKNDPMLIEPLRRLGESFYFVDTSVSAQQQAGLISTGELYFKRAVRIAERNDDIDWRVLAKTKLALADYYIYTESSNRSRRLYKEVWDLLASDDEKLAYRSEAFDMPVPTRFEALPTHAGGSPPVGNEQLLTGKVTVDYTVSARGRVRDMVTEVKPLEFTDMQRMVHREIRSRGFRPRLVDGIPTETPNMVFEHEFTYLQSDLDAIRKANEQESSTAASSR